VLNYGGYFQIGRERKAWQGRNKLTALPKEIEKLTALQRLSVDNNQLTALPKEIEKLTALQRLSVDNNQLTALPKEIEKLTALQGLYVDNNQLTALPKEIADLDNLGELKLDGNPLVFPTPEIIEQGLDAIKTALREEQRRIWMSKLLIVGEAGVGKTNLLRRLLGEDFVEDSETTHGMEVRTLPLPHPRQPDVKMQLIAWDFGGQDIYHATHKFFLTQRSLYLVVWNARLGFEQGKLDYWLDIIKASSGGSPVLLVATHTDERAADLALADLKRNYPQIVDNFPVSNKEGGGEFPSRMEQGRSASGLPRDHAAVQVQFDAPARHSDLVHRQTAPVHDQHSLALRRTDGGRGAQASRTYPGFSDRDTPLGPADCAWAYSAEFFRHTAGRPRVHARTLSRAQLHPIDPLS
jgi:GTPase SAR1 family protein